jgi:pimeloyl-ACP methyl ester carboxylesterase
MCLMRLCMTALLATLALAADLDTQVEHGYADSSGVKIHYASIGKGPLIVMIHGFPDFWYTWRNQMQELSKSHRVVAMDLRGYNLSDKPKGGENYDMKLLAGDVIALIKHLGEKSAVVVGHDWGGAIAWTVAMNAPDVVDKLIILNLPHPRGLTRELSSNPKQHANSSYARTFQQEGAHTKLTAETLSAWVRDPSAKAKYMEAFGRSDLEAMLHYYKRNYPREPYRVHEAFSGKVKAPVLMIHGLDDQYLLAGALNNTWEWLEKDLTLVTIPGAGHFVQHDAADLVTRSIRMWLGR